MPGKKVRYLSVALTVLFSLFFIPLGAARPADESHEKHSLSPEEIVRGERLFYGLVYMDEKSVNCAACHNARFNESDSMNWNPDAWELAQKYASKNVEALEKVLLNPAGLKLSVVHEDFDLSVEDITMIKAYMDNLADTGLIHPKPVINRLIIFIILLLVNLFFLADLLVVKKINPKWIHLIIILGTGFFLTKIMVEDAIAIGRSENYAPDQPVKFSHAIHAGLNETECLYCHSQAEYSKSAGIPGVNVCMNCHLIVRNGTQSGAWEINKVISSYEGNEPLEWIRVHNNPDHVFFSHAQHVSIGKLDCAECHGDIESMDRVMQVSDLSMGWCINCHREKKVDFHSNAFYSSYTKLRDDIKQGLRDSVTVDVTGGIECMKCHY